MLTNSETLKLNLEDLKWVHFIGISSPFSSFCATSLIDLGIKVTASEISQNSDSARKWKERGVLYEGAHNSKFVHRDLDLVVYPNGPMPGNPECEQAEKLNISTVTVGQLTGLITKNKKTIAVIGTHGKTTTTALIVWVMRSLGETPNYILGDATDYVSEIGSTWNVNKNSKFFVVEACEYKEQFIQRAPNPFMTVVTHIDLDHTDYYPTQESYNEAFTKFVLNTNGCLFINAKGENEKLVVERIEKSLPKLKIIDLSKIKVANIESNLKGKHNFQNNLRAYAVGIELGYDKDAILTALKRFKGLSKRFEYVGSTANSNLVYRDYAHNPSKIAALIEGARESYTRKELVLIFEPHSVERAYSFKNEFASALKGADTTIISNIFSPSRESEQERNLISSEEFAKFVISILGENKSYFCDNKEELIDKVKELDNYNNNTVFIIASAGKLQELGGELINHEE